MKIIRISTEHEISVHEWPEGLSITEENHMLRELIGPKCRYVEHVMPVRLYSVLGGSKHVTKEKGNCVSMLVDEEGLLNGSEMNVIGSWLYGTDAHGAYIAGNILIIGEIWHGHGISFCGMSDEQFEILFPKLEEVTGWTREIDKEHANKNGGGE